MFACLGKTTGLGKLAFGMAQVVEAGRGAIRNFRDVFADTKII